MDKLAKFDVSGYRQDVISITFSSFPYQWKISAWEWKWLMEGKIEQCSVQVNTFPNIFIAKIFSY